MLECFVASKQLIPVEGHFLLKIGRHIAKDRPANAEKMLTLIKSKVVALAVHPRIGHNNLIDRRSPAQRGWRKSLTDAFSHLKQRTARQSRMLLAGTQYRF